MERTKNREWGGESCVGVGNSKKKKKLDGDKNRKGKWI